MLRPPTHLTPGGTWCFIGRKGDSSVVDVFTDMRSMCKMTYAFTKVSQRTFEENKISKPDAGVIMELSDEAKS